MKNVKYIDLVLENCDVVRLKNHHVLSFYISGITESISYYGFFNNTKRMDKTLHCDYFSILINKPKCIKQESFYDGYTDAYEMITCHSDITAINIIYDDSTEEYIYVDFNDYNDNYNINQKNEYYEEYEELEVSITKENFLEFFDSCENSKEGI